MLKRKLAELLEKVIVTAQEGGFVVSTTLPEVSVEYPQNPEHGDYASSLPLKLSRATGGDPLLLAETIVKLLPPIPEVAEVRVASPGFINFVLRNDWLTSQVDYILAAGDEYGSIDLGRGSPVQIEFVSVNPTGPLHVGHGRGAVLGATLANVLTSAGYAVSREYYINDTGSQIEAFNRSLYVRYQQSFGVKAEMPPGGYFGNYVIELAEEIISEKGERFLTLPEEETIAKIGETGLNKTLRKIKEDLELLGVHFDNWFSERSLYQGGQYDKVMALLEEGGFVTEKENAVWFVSSALGEDKDNVLVRSDGSPTYFASDVAYHYNKFLERHFDTVINIWGADHQGHVSRMKAVVGALGIDSKRLKIIICQLVTLRRGGEIVRVSKRSGDIITLRELIEEVGRDTCHFFFLSRSADSQMDFDLELAKKQSVDNPVYYVQYGHARIASILRLAEERQIDYSQGDVSLLTTEPELALIRKMTLLPELVETVALTLEPHHLPYYAQDLATVFHSFYKQCRVISGDDALTQARLKLVKAAQIVLAKTLNLMGITAPERM